MTGIFTDHEVMTSEDVARAVVEIKAIAADDERAHAKEDELYAIVMAHIRDGVCRDPAACCREALKTKEIKFDRHCA